MDKKKKIAQLIIARLDGRDISKKVKYYESLVKKGIGGFIVFGGRLKEVRNGIKKLQAKAEIPLFIASDLEQGLGQQIEGGTLFPPAMALANAVNQKNNSDVKFLRKLIGIIAKEAKATGINLIFSPVLDVNTNPKNPIICTRAFSDDPEEVAWFGKEFIKGFQKQGVIACAKHFPGHGDTTKDSHRELPVVHSGLKRLHSVELYPFKQAVKAGIKMIMVGHLKVPALDSRFPSSLSQKVIQGLLREKMKFKGLVITDAMNMQAVIKGRSQPATSLRAEPQAEGSVESKSEARSCLLALNAGADILLHPEEPEKVIGYLSKRWGEIMPRVEESFQRILRAKKELSRGQPAPLRGARPGGSGVRGQKIETKTGRALAYKLTQKSIKIKNKLEKLKESPVVLIIDDDNCASGKCFIKTIKSHYKKVNPIRKMMGLSSNGVKTIYIDNKYQGSITAVLNSISNKILIAAVFSKISAWKGRSGLNRKLKTLLEKALKTSSYSIIVGFCCPYILCELKADVVIEAYSGSEVAQEAVGKILCTP